MVTQRAKFVPPLTTERSGASNQEMWQRQSQMKQASKPILDRRALTIKISSLGSTRQAGLTRTLNRQHGSQAGCTHKIESDGKPLVASS